MTLYIGLMSGTSMDGIDAALVHEPSHRLEYGITRRYSDDVYKMLEQLVQGNQVSLSLICQLNTLIGREFAKATSELLQKANISPHEIKAIGSHGQTICHDTSGSIPYTLQLGCGHAIASLSKITVVADFRTRDLINGGQGAPFAPLYHQELFKQANEPIALVNLGGIANVSFIKPKEAIKGWDIGPANCLMDAWINKHKGESFDKDGLWAQQGELIPSLLDSLLSDPFFALMPPKSIGKEYFSLAWLESHIKETYHAVDVQTTLLYLTAHSIANTLSRHNTFKKVYLCGGGAHNQCLHNVLANLLPSVSVSTTDDVGINPDYLEAMMFAWLASQTLHKIPLDLSSITGSNGPELLGAIYQA